MSIQRRSLLLGAAAAAAIAAPLPLARAAESKPKLLMTGHLGNIGSRLIPFFEPAYEVVGIDKKEGAEFDLSVRNDAWAGRIAGVDTIVHLAATANPYADAFDVYQNNVLATSRLVEEAIKAGTRRVVFASSTNVSPVQYGNPVGTYGPATPYGASKLFGEVLLENAVRDRKLTSAASVRVGWVPRPSMDMSQTPFWLQAIFWTDGELRRFFAEAFLSPSRYTQVGQAPLP